MTITNNWHKLKLEYMRGSITLRELARKHHISASQVFNISKSEGWVKARDEYQRQIVAEGLARVQDKDADKIARMVTSADKMVDHIEKALSDQEQFQKYLVNDVELDDDGNPYRQTTVERVFTRYDTRAMREMASALKEMTSVIRNVNNIPTEAEAQQMQMAREKHQKEMDKDESSKDIIVRFEGDTKEWAE